MRNFLLKRGPVVVVVALVVVLLTAGLGVTRLLTGHVIEAIVLFAGAIAAYAFAVWAKGQTEAE